MNKFEQMREQLKNGVAVVSAPQLFPTPPALVKRMIADAEIDRGHRVLEPSAGTGAILRELLKVADNVTAIEMNSALSMALGNCHCHDFLEWAAEWRTVKFDRIVMNPPFEKSQDIDHVRAAYDCLRPGGRIVAIMGEGAFFRGDRKARDFREWLDELAFYSERLPEDTFKESGTRVRCRLVIIQRED